MHSLLHRSTLALALAGLLAGPVLAQPAMPPSAVGIIVAKPETLPVTNELPGRIVPTRIAEVRPRVSGIVVERVFQQGTVVREGDVLYRIDPGPFLVQVASAEATLQRAKAAQLNARQTAERITTLRERNVISDQQRDDTVGALALADADVALAEANLAAARLNLDYSEVKAPISGRIGRANITEGALVGPTDVESLARVQQLDPVYADFTQPASELLRLRRAFAAGELSMTGEAEPAARLKLSDGSDYAHVGTLLFSEATVDETTGQVTMRASFPNPEGDLLPGLYVRVAIEQAVQNDALAIPRQAVQYDGGGQALIYLVGADNVVERRVVRTGRLVGDRIVVEEGLAAGERVIVEGFQKIGPGATVAPTEWKTAMAAPGAAPAAAAEGKN